LESQNFSSETSIFGNHIHVITNENFSGKEQIKTALSNKNITVKRIDEIVPTLEDVFVHLLSQKESK